MGFLDSYGCHRVKSVQIRIYFWSVFSCIRTENRKIQTRNNSVFGHFSRSEIENDFPPLNILADIWQSSRYTSRIKIL